MEIKDIEAAYDKAVKPLQKKCEKYNGLTVTIPMGEYKGRKGVVSGCQISRGNVIGMIQPIRLKGGPPDDYLWYKADARTFWDLKDVKELT